MKSRIDPVERIKLSKGLTYAAVSVPEIQLSHATAVRDGRETLRDGYRKPTSTIPPKRN